jgi:hypothetical protein
MSIDTEPILKIRRRSADDESQREVTHESTGGSCEIFLWQEPSTRRSAPVASPGQFLILGRHSAASAVRKFADNHLARIC